MLTRSLSCTGGDRVFSPLRRRRSTPGVGRGTTATEKRFAYLFAIYLYVIDFRTRRNKKKRRSFVPFLCVCVCVCVGVYAVVRRGFDCLRKKNKRTNNSIQVLARFILWSFHNNSNVSLLCVCVCVCVCVWPVPFCLFLSFVSLFLYEKKQNKMQTKRNGNE